MFKNLVTFLSIAMLATGCLESAKKSNAVANQTARVSDSSKLVTHLDSLMLLKLPHSVNESDYYPDWQIIDLSMFKAKQLFNLPSKVHSRLGIGNTTDSTFNLTDKNYRTHWLLVARTPNYFIVLVNGKAGKDYSSVKLVSMSYDLRVIDAMSVEGTAPGGNDRFHGFLSTTIHRNLTMTLRYQYETIVDPNAYTWQVEEVVDDLWAIDNNGRFRLIKRGKGNDE